MDLPAPDSPTTPNISHGEILLEGKRIDNLSDDEMEKIRGKSIGAIFQDPLTSMNPLFTIGVNADRFDYLVPDRKERIQTG